MTRVFRNAVSTLILLAIAVLLSTTGVLRQPSAGAAPPVNAVYSDELIIVYNDDPAAADEMLSELRVQTVDRSPSLRAERVVLPAGASIAEATERLRKLPNVAYVEPNIRLRSSVIPNDPKYSEQWYTDLIGLPAAWARQTGDPAVIVAVIDTGAEITHEDLQSRLWVNSKEVPGNGLDDDANGCVDDLNGCNFLTLNQERKTICGYTREPPHYDVNDDADHGTAVAGVIGAAGNNGVGIAGTAWNVRLMIVKAMDCLQSGSGFDVARAVDYAVANGARIINLSLGGPNSSVLLTSAINRAAAAGVLVLAASGNDNTNRVDFPAFLSSVMAVGGSDRAHPDGRATFSSWGPEIDIAAPAVAITTTARANAYQTVTGTSFATPLVSGVAALLASQNPTLTATQLRQILEASARKLPEGDTPNWAGAGRVRADAALERVPSTFVGTVLINGVPAPPGTRVEAFVGNVRCGETEAFSFPGGSTRYAMQVEANTVRLGCGTPGGRVNFRILGAPLPLDSRWQGTLQNADLQLALPDRLAIDLVPGWNLVALTVDPVTTSLPQILSPLKGQLEAAFLFDAQLQQFQFYIPDNAAVSTAQTLHVGQGMWLRMRTPSQLKVDGIRPRGGGTVALVKGLNLVGFPLAAPAAVEAVLQPIMPRLISVFGYTGGDTGHFQAFIAGAPVEVNTLAQLEDGKGYWVITNAATTLTLPPTAGLPTPFGSSMLGATTP